MAKKRVVEQPDPAQAANQRVLEDRAKRIQAQEPALDLDLQLKEAEPANAVEFLRDAFDKRNFGEPLPTVKRIIYGPDPLLKACPEMRARIEKIGLEAFAHTTAETILLREEMAVPDPLMRKQLRAAIARFGKEAVADAFRDRILRIPQREVEVEVDRGIDEMLGRPLDEAVERYGQDPGFSYKFLSPRCLDVLGRRGYELVLDERGDVVKVGTLLMGRIPTQVAERRRLHWAEESMRQVREAEEVYTETVERQVREAGAVAAGSRPLRRDELMVANATESEEYLGESRAGGIRFETE